MWLLNHFSFFKSFAPKVWVKITLACLKLFLLRSKNLEDRQLRQSVCKHGFKVVKRNSDVLRVWVLYFFQLFTEYEALK